MTPRNLLAGAIGFGAVLFLCVAGCFAQTRFEREVIRLTNVERVAAGVAPLEYDARLSNAAVLWCEILKGRRILEHALPIDQCGPLGVDVDRDGWCNFTDRAWFFGWPTASLSENGAALKSMSPQQLVWAWMNSPGHRSNMLNPAWTHCGVGKGTFGAGKQLAFMEFGAE